MELTTIHDTFSSKSTMDNPAVPPNPPAPAGATAISPRREPWVRCENTNGSPGRGGSESGVSSSAPRLCALLYRLADCEHRSCGNRYRPSRGCVAVLRSVSHGSRRGLIAIAPTGAGIGQAGELEERIANNVAKLLEAAL
jgi:hypothetical protein